MLGFRRLLFIWNPVLSFCPTSSLYSKKARVQSRLKAVFKGDT
jgi:hypothetical protein